MKHHPLDTTDLTWLSGLARALLGDAHAADDLVQETAIAAMQGHLPLGEPRRAWLASVARRLAARRFRGEARRSRREEWASQSELLPDAAELVEKAEIAEQVTAAARALPEPFRRTILLRYLEGRSAEEIAREEGKPVDTVRWRVRRGLKLLREELVRRHDRDWSSWSVLLLPLARIHGDVGLATAGASGALSGMVVSLAAMKTLIAVALALGCAGLWFAWDSGDVDPSSALVAAAVPVAEDPREIPAPELDAEDEPAELEPSRVGVTTAPAMEPAAPAPKPRNLRGRVVDEDGQPVAEATVYLIPTIETDGDEEESGPVRASTQSDGEGAFEFSPADWETEASERSGVLDLGVAANGYLRTVLADVMASPLEDERIVVVERGRTLTGRVVDERGLPCTDLELLVCSTNARIDHVSPSQRLLRAERNLLSGAASDYQQCRATTDQRGEVRFSGLPEGELKVLSLDPGWAIEEPQVVAPGESYVVWTAQQCLGVRLVVVERGTGQPVERASAKFSAELAMANGDVLDHGQWVGRGTGGASFLLHGDVMFGLEERTIERATFYGTVRSGEGDAVEWEAEPIDAYAAGPKVVEVRVEVDSQPGGVVASTSGEEAPEEEPPTARLSLDVRYEDSAPFEGELWVGWVTESNPTDGDSALAEQVGLGRYAVEVPVGQLKFEVWERYSSGSFPRWRGELSLYEDQEVLEFVTLPRGATAILSRPEGWSGNWSVRATWRPEGSEEWQGGLGYGTEAETLTLPVLRPAEWRFELSRESALGEEPLVRIVLLEEGDAVLVDE